MTNRKDSSRNSPSPAPTGDAGAADPAALTVVQLARLLGLAESKVRRHIAAGAPTAADGSVNLVHYTAWLNRRLKEHDGD